MPRYDKYIKIINECDSFMEKKGMKLIEGKAASQDQLIKDMTMLEKILCVMHKAWQVAWEIDRLDDIQAVMSKVAEKGDGPDPSIEAMLNNVGFRSEKGRDFRGGRRYSKVESRAGGGHSSDVWPEESRRRYRRRTRSLGYPDEDVEALTEKFSEEEIDAFMDIMDEVENRRHRDSKGRFTSFGVLPWSPSFWGSRMGYDTNPRMPENNQPYAQMVPMPMTMPFGHTMPQAGLVHAPLQSNGNHEMANEHDNGNGNTKATNNNGKTGGAE